jgi:hypothetical protein
VVLPRFNFYGFGGGYQELQQSALLLRPNQQVYDYFDFIPETAMQPTTPSDS